MNLDRIDVQHKLGCTYKKSYDVTLKLGHVSASAIEKRSTAPYQWPLQ